MVWIIRWVYLWLRILYHLPVETFFHIVCLLPPLLCLSTSTLGTQQHCKLIESIVSIQETTWFFSPHWVSQKMVMRWIFTQRHWLHSPQGLWMRLSSFTFRQTPWYCMGVPMLIPNREYKWYSDRMLFKYCPIMDWKFIPRLDFLIGERMSTRMTI